MFKAWLKSKTSDKLLYKIKKQIADNIPKDSSVLEIGSGTGNQLIMLSPKIKEGAGIDIDSSRIQFARRIAKEKRIKNIKFKVMNAQSLDSLKKRFDIGIAILTIHEMNYHTQISVLKKLSKISKKVIIADHILPNKTLTRILVYIDEHLAGHYDKFKLYIDRGGMEKLLNDANLSIIKQLKTSISTINLWICKSKLF